MNGRNLIFFPPTPLNARVANLEKHADFRRLLHYEPILDGLSPLIGADVAFSRASTATYIDDDGVLQYAAVNEQRLQDGGGLLEPERTNLNPESEDFSVGYSVSGTLVQVTGQPSPDGTNSATLMEDDDGSASESIYRPAMPLTAGHVASSWFVKQGSALSFTIGLYGAGQWQFLVEVTWEDGLPVGSGVKYRPLKDGWFRIWYNMVVPTTTTYSQYLYPASNVASATGSTCTWGWQLEEGRYPTSYIPSSGGTATRQKDGFSAPRPFGLSVQSDFTALVNAVPLFGDEEGISTGFFLMGDSAPRIRTPYPSYSPDRYVLMLDGFSVDSVHNVSSGTFDAGEDLDVFMLSDADGDFEYTAYENGTPSDTDSKAWDEVKDDEDEFGGSKIIEYYDEAWIIKSLIVTSGLMPYERIKAYQRS